MQAPSIGNPGLGASVPWAGPLSPLGLCHPRAGTTGGNGISLLTDPSTAQLPASLISMRHSPSVTTATSCSAPSGVTAPAILVKGRPVPCPVSHGSAQPGLRVLSLKPASPPGPEISAPSSCPAPPRYVCPSPRPPVAPAPPPTAREEAGSDGWHYQGSFPRARYLAASRFSLLLQEAGGDGGGAAGISKRRCSAGRGSRTAELLGES